MPTPAPEPRPVALSPAPAFARGSLAPRVWVPAEGGPSLADSLDPADLWQTLRRNALWIGLIALLVMGSVSAITLLSPMTFVSSGRLYLGELDVRPAPPGMAAGALDLSGGNQGDVASEVAILKSRALVERSVLESGLNVHLEPELAEPVRYLEWRLSRRDQRLLDIGARLVRATETQVEGQGLEPEVFAVEFLGQGRYRVLRRGVALGEGRFGQRESMGKLHLRLDAGLEGQPAPGARYALVVAPLGGVAERAMNTLEVVAPQQMGQEPIRVVTLTFAGSSPLATARFVERLMQNYLSERQAWKTENASAAEVFVTKQLHDLRKSLGDIETRLAEYRTENSVVVHDEEAQAMVGQIGKYEEQRVAARLEVASLSAVKKGLEDPNTPVESYMLGEARDTVLEGLASTLAMTRAELADQETRFLENAPDVREQRAKVAAQLAAIKSYVNGRLSRAQQNLGTLNGIIGQYEARLRTVPGAELKLAQLARESEVYSSIYSFLLQKQQQAAIVKASNVSQNRVLDPPQVARFEDSPKLALALLSGPLGLVLGAGAVLAATLFSGRLLSEKDLARSLGRVPVFARLPRRTKGRRSLSAEAIVDVQDPRLASGYVEAVRSLRAKLVQATVTRRSTVVLISSPGEGDGKTTCTLALASLLAADNKRVLVVDADLTKPSHHLLLANVRRAPGVDRRRERRGWFGAPEPVQGAFGTFDSLCFEDGVAPELLSSEKMTLFLAQARELYDVILLDAASFPRYSDALVLAQESDLLLSVMRLRRTKRKEAFEHLQGLTESGLPFAIVLNDPAWAAHSEQRSAPRRHHRPTVLRRATRELGEVLSEGESRG